jgi:hypothetical protein
MVTSVRDCHDKRTGKHRVSGGVSMVVVMMMMMMMLVIPVVMFDAQL